MQLTRRNRLRFSLVVLWPALVLGATAARAADPAELDNQNPLADLRQTMVADIPARDEVVAEDESVTFALDGERLVVTRSGRKRWIKLKSNEIGVSQVLEVSRMRLSELSPTAEMRRKWQTFFKSNLSGTRFGGLVLSCRAGPCITRTVQRVTTCLTGCAGRDVSPLEVETETVSRLYIPASTAAEARYVAGTLATLVIAAQEADEPE